jgi:UDP-2,3-diacylglucosamine pyrophosphatase LpxH
MTKEPKEPKPSGGIDWREIDALRAKLTTPRLQVQQQELDEVKFVRYDFDKRRFAKFPKSIELMMLTDTQIGAKAFRRDRFVEYRDWMLSEPFRFAFLGGDMIDAATVLSVGSPYDNTSEPLDQLDEATSLLQPLAKAGRLLGYVGGNHERRTIKTFGDSGRLLARNLQVPYSRGVQLIDIYYGNHKPFKVSLWHGSGAARTKGAKAQMLHRFMGQADSHLYLVGHLHDALMLMDWRQQRTGRRIKLQKIAGCMSSSFLGYFNTYAETAGLSPSDTMMARTILDPKGHWEITWK